MYSPYYESINTVKEEAMLGEIVTFLIKKWANSLAG